MAGGDTGWSGRSLPTQTTPTPCEIINHCLEVISGPFQNWPCCSLYLAVSTAGPTRPKAPELCRNLLPVPLSLCPSALNCATQTGTHGGDKTVLHSGRRNGTRDWSSRSFNHGTPDWFGLKETLKIIHSHPLPWAGTPSTIPGCSEPRPIKPWTLQGWGSHSSSGQPVPGPHHPHCK